MLSLPGEHAFAASMSKELGCSPVGRESMAPTSTSGPMADDLLTDCVHILFVALRFPEANKEFLSRIKP